MSLVFASICPHPPILLQGVPKKTFGAMKKLEGKFACAKPETVIIISPHSNHGLEVPLYFLKSEAEIRPILDFPWDLQECFQMGKDLKIPQKRTALIASGDLSHRITPDAPAGYSPRGGEFDQKLIRLLKKNNVKGILNLEPSLIEEAGECGLRPIIILLGALSSYKYQFKILSYEAPFGVGYLVAQATFSPAP